MGALLSRNAKAVISAIGGVLTLLVSVTGFAQYVPASVWVPAGGVLAAIEVLRSVNVWFVRNEPVLNAAVASAGELVDDVRTALHTPAPAAAAPAVPAASVPAPVAAVAAGGV